MHTRQLLAAAVLAATAQLASADVDQFTVNAQYRGVVKKAFTSIGSGQLSDSGQAGGTFRIQGQAEVDHPKEDREYRMKIDMTFRQDGNSIREVANRSTANPGSEEALRTTMKILPFVHIAKWADPEQGEGTYVTPRGRFSMRFARAERNLEASLYEGDRMVGKFFMSPDGGVPRKMEKFRIATRTGTMLSFVSTGAYASR